MRLFSAGANFVLVTIVELHTPTLVNEEPRKNREINEASKNIQKKSIILIPWYHSLL